MHEVDIYGFSVWEILRAVNNAFRLRIRREWRRQLQIQRFAKALFSLRNICFSYSDVVFKVSFLLLSPRAGKKETFLSERRPRKNFHHLVGRIKSHRGRDVTQTISRKTQIPFFASSSLMNEEICIIVFFSPFVCLDTLPRFLFSASFFLYSPTTTFSYRF